MDAVRYVRKVMEPLAPISTGIAPKLKRIPGIRAVVFDIYGTLLISAAGDLSHASKVNSLLAMEKAVASIDSELMGSDSNSWLEAYQDSLAKRQQMRSEEGIEFPEIEIREVWRDVIEKLAPEICDEGNIERIAMEYEYAVNPCWAMPHSHEVLLELRNRKLSLGLISNSQFYTHALFEGLIGISTTSSCWAQNLTRYSYQIREGKPSVRLFESVKDNAAGIGIMPQEILYIGNDFCKDVLPAQKVGFRAALFAGDKRSFRPGPEGSDNACRKSDAVLTDLGQLDDLV